ncbi:MAG: AMIN domain-containing protein [Campylobacterota bacterium]|nr:AMIN domain-containing protein [Campylobacterota bacterium]
MKWIYLTLLIVVLGAQARENPFEPTAAYLEDEQRILETEREYAQEFQKKQIVETKKEEPVIVPPVVKKEIPNVAVQESKIKKLIKSIEKQLPVENKPEPVVVQEPQKVVDEPVNVQPVAIETIVAKEVFNPTSFVKLINYEDRLEIYTTHKVFRKFNLNDVSKIVLDYHARVNFYTQKSVLDSEYFDVVTVGNHKKQRYFRVVIKTKNHPASYKVTHQGEMVTIYKMD